jgi:hypothetical protein
MNSTEVSSLAAHNISYQLTPTSFCNHQGTDGTIINKQVHSLCSPLYRARNSVVCNSITALELCLCKTGKAFFTFYVTLLFQLADRANTKDVKVFVQNGLHYVSTIPTETKFHAHWVSNSMQPRPTRSCTSTFSTLCCQETGSISTCYFSRIT